MKNILNINLNKSGFGKLLLLVIAFQLISCESWYETFPKDELLEQDFWKNSNDVEAAVLTGYYDLRNLQDDLILFGLLRSDIIKPTRSEMIKWQKGVYSSKDKICNWGRWYRLIMDMNVVLAKAEAVKDIDAGFSDQKYNELLAEAKFLRAFAYFNLIRMWKNVPIVTEPSLNDQQDYFPAKSESPDQVFTLIKEDLDFATANLPKEYKFEGEVELSKNMTRARATAGAAWALYSDVSLWLNEYEDCIYACDQILNSNLYGLLDGAYWWDIFDPQKGNTRESIFELNYEDNFDHTDRHNSSRYKYSMEEWFKNYLLTRPISAIWPQPDERLRTLTGIRLDVVRKHAGADWGGNQLIGTGFNPNWVIYRLPHILFNKAEAMNRSQGSAAINEINAMVYSMEERSGVINYELISGGVKSVEELILQYKLKETAFEGTRWFDLVRIGKRQWDENLTGEDNILVRNLVSIMNEEDKIFVKGLLNNPEAWYFPISNGEIDINQNLVQNPFYQNN